MRLSKLALRTGRTMLQLLGDAGDCFMRAGMGFTDRADARRNTA